MPDSINFYYYFISTLNKGMNPINCCVQALWCSSPKVAPSHASVLPLPP